jgi:hypothetical protein
MNMTRILPTDKYGEVYYGPTTFAEAQELINDGAPVNEIYDMLRHAGYTGVANRIQSFHKYD